MHHVIQITLHLKKTGIQVFVSSLRFEKRNEPIVLSMSLSAQRPKYRGTEQTQWIINALYN